MKRSTPIPLITRLLWLSILAIFCISLHPRSAQADPAAFDPTGNRLEISIQKRDSAKGVFPLGGSWEWDHDSNTLTLENAVVKDTSGTFNGFLLRSDKDSGPFIIKFKGTNTIFANRGGYPACAINYAGPQDLIFEGEGPDATLNLEATSYKDGSSYGSPITISATHSPGEDQPSLIFKSGSINVIAEHHVADMNLDELSDPDFRGAYSPMGIFGSIKKLEVQDQARLTVKATTDDTEQFTAFSINLSSLKEAVFNSTYPTIFEATTGTKEGKKFGFIAGNAQVTFSAKAPVHFNTTGLGSPVYTKTFAQAFVSAEPDAYEIGVMNPATGFLNNNFVAASTSMTQLAPVFGTSEEHDVAIGRVYRIEQSFETEDGKKIVVERNNKRVEPIVSTNGKIVIQRSLRPGADSYVLVDKVPVKLEAPAKLGNLVFKEWKNLDGLGVAASDLENPVVNFIMPAHHIQPVAVYEPVRTGQIQVHISGDNKALEALKLNISAADGTALPLEHEKNSSTWTSKNDLTAGTYVLSVSEIPEGFELIYDSELQGNMNFKLTAKDPNDEGLGNGEANENDTDESTGDQASSSPLYSADLTITKEDLRQKQLFIVGLKINPISKEVEPSPEPRPTPEEPQPVDPQPVPGETKPLPDPAPSVEPDNNIIPEPAWTKDPWPAEPTKLKSPLLTHKLDSSKARLPKTNDISISAGSLSFMLLLGLAAVTLGMKRLRSMK